MENQKNENTPEKKWAKAMLELDLSMESGAIWTDFMDGYCDNKNAEKEKKLSSEFLWKRKTHMKLKYLHFLRIVRYYLQKSPIEKFYKIKNEPMILDGEPTIYGNHKIPNRIFILR